MLIYLLFLVIFLLLNIPVALILLGLSVIYLIIEQIPLYIVVVQLSRGLDNFVLLAVPFFIFAARIMNEGGVSDRLIEFSQSVIGWLKGGLAHVNVLASMLFAGMSGAAVADAGGLGNILIPSMINKGYDKKYSAAITAVSSTIGPIIPPSIPMVIYGMLADESVGKLFLGGAVPGFLMGVFLIAANYIWAKDKGHLIQPWAGWKKLFKDFCKAFPALLTPGIILGGIITGITTPTEAALLAIVYSLILGYIYKNLSWKVIKSAALESAKTTAIICIIISTASLFGWIVSRERIPQLLIDLLTGFTDSRTVVLVLFMLFFFILGAIMETNAILILTVPVLLPILRIYDISTLHFGVIMVLNLMIGLCTPPFGVVLYLISDISGVPVMKLSRTVFPLLIPLIIVLVISVFIPGVVTWLPGLLFQR